MTEIRILTCCYCGARQAVRAGKGKRRSLTCENCGAGIIRLDCAAQDGKDHRPAHPREATPPPPRRHAPLPEHKRKKKKGKRKKSGFAKLWDAAEDVLDFLDLD